MIKLIFIPILGETRPGSEFQTQLKVGDDVMLVGIVELSLKK
jgi:hypothetical protein